MGTTCSSIKSNQFHRTTPDSIVEDRRQSDAKIIDFSLTIDQKKLINETWHNINEKEFGTKVFVRIFSANPEIFAFFGFDEKKKWSEDELRSSTKFVSHSSNFVSFINMIVGHLNGNEPVGLKVCKVIGRKHVNFAASGGRPFEPKYWKTFAGALLDEMENELKKQFFTEKTVRMALLTWMDLFEKIVILMETEYNHGKHGKT